MIVENVQILFAAHSGLAASQVHLPEPLGLAEEPQLELHRDVLHLCSCQVVQDRGDFRDAASYLRAVLPRLDPASQVQHPAKARWEIAC